MTDPNPDKPVLIVPLPEAMVRRAREFRGDPAPVRPAATVVLLRPDGNTFQMYVMKRAATMVFGGLHAFPGGGVDPSDRPETIRTDWADLLGVPEEQAHAVVGAAARELFEEAGVLLAGPIDQPDRTVSDGALTGIVSHGNEAAHSSEAAGTDEAGDKLGRRDEAGHDDQGGYGDQRGHDAVIGDVSADDWEADRAAVAAHELTMTDLLARRGLRLRDDLLFPWDRWITPEFEPKRFDTWFFVALLPEGQTARDVSGESEVADWVRPEAANGLAMLPPTRSTVNSLRPYRKIADVVAGASRRDAATPVMPRVEFTDDGGAVLHLG